MSEASYWLNVERGVTGVGSSTCLLASFDRISPVSGIRTETYEAYRLLRYRFRDSVGDHNNYIPDDITTDFTALQATFRAELGVPTVRNIVEARVNTPEELQRKLAKLSIGGYRTALYLYTEYLHAVGVLARGNNTYEVRSTSSPFPEDTLVTADELFSKLHLASRKRKRPERGCKTYVEPNIFALPPEPPGCRPPYPHL